MNTKFLPPARLFLVVLIALAAAPASAKPTEAVVGTLDADLSNLPKLTDQQLLDLFNQTVREQSADFCQLSVLFSEMAERNFTGDIDKARFETATQCAVDRQDWPEAYRNITQWEKLGGKETPPLEWAFRLAYLAEEYDEALDRLEVIANLDDPAQLIALSQEFVYSLARQLFNDENDDRMVRLFQMLFLSPHFERLSGELRSTSAYWTLKRQVKTNDAGDIGKTLAEITSPYSYTALLANRSYQQIWPQIEQHAGPNMALILGSYLQDKKREFESAPQDKEKKQQYGHALLFSGRFDDLVRLAASIDHSDTGRQNWQEDDGWLLNLEAYALDAQGNTQAADRIFDQFAKIDYQPGKNDWLVNFVINRASRLVGQRRWQEGLEAAQLANEYSGSPYADMLVRQARFCALHGLGRSAEAQAVLSDIVEHQNDALEVAVEALLCAGEREQAASMTIKGLNDDNKQAQFVEALQKPEFEFFYAESSLPGIHDELSNHPDVARVFDRIARMVPDEYIPLVGVKRRELAAERRSD